MAAASCLISGRMNQRRVSRMVTPRKNRPTIMSKLSTSSAGAALRYTR
jgi:hypothetical protein